MAAGTRPPMRERTWLIQCRVNTVPTQRCLRGVFTTHSKGLHMSGIRQPWLGVAASAALVAISLLAMLPWGYATFGGVVANVLMCSIPFSVVVTSFWHSREPEVIGRLPQPLRGLAYLVVTAVVAVGIYLLESATIGGGKGDTPFLTFGIIVSVIVSLWFAMVLGGWPFSLIPNKLVGGSLLLASTYLLAAAILRTFDFSFLAGAPFYGGMDPAGPVPAWDGLVIIVTFLAVVFLFLHLDLWPMSRIRALATQPVLGIASTAAALGIGGAVYYLATAVFGMTPDAFLVTVPVPFIFGSVLLLTMLEGSVTFGLVGPRKGAATAALATVLGTGLAALYVVAMPLVTSDVPPPTPTGGAFDQHMWLASALLAMTFPLMAIHHGYFDLWPLRRTTAPRATTGGDSAMGGPPTLAVDAR